MLIPVMSSVFLEMGASQFFKYFFKYSLIMFLATVLFSIVGINPLLEGPAPSSSAGRLSGLAYTFGFNNQNTVFTRLFPIILSGYLLYGYRKAFYVIAILATVILGYYTGNRTGLFVISLFLITSFLFRHLPRRIKIGKRILISLLLPAATAVSFSLIYIYSIHPEINTYFSGRPGLMSMYNEAGLLDSPLGNINFVKYEHSTIGPIDNFPLYILAAHGYIGYIIFSFIFIIGTIYETNKRVLYLIPFIFLYGMFEHPFLDPVVNFLVLIFIYNICFRGNKKTKLKDVNREYPPLKKIKVYNEEQLKI